MAECIKVKCVVCHRDVLVYTNDKKLHQSKIVTENKVCKLCEPNVSRIRVVLKCSKCQHDFQTKVLTENKDKYGADWVCPMCVSNDLPQVKSKEEKKKCVELNCDGCRVGRGVCVHPELNCTLSKSFARFGTGDLYSVKKACTVLSVHNVIAKRKDVHCFEYTPLSTPISAQHFPLIPRIDNIATLSVGDILFSSE